MRPKSVVQAEWLYLASIVLLVVLAVLGWKDAVAASGVAAAFGINAFFVGLSLLLLILTTRRASRVALWALVVVTVLTDLGFLYQVSSGVLAAGLFGALVTVQAALATIGVVFLFRPNARAWFDDRAHRPETDA